MYKVYVKTGNDGYIISVNSEAFLPDPVPAGWTQIDEGEGDKYHHAQSNYFDKPLMTDDGKYQYRIVDGAVVENDLTPTLDELKAAKRAEIWGAGDAILARVKANFTVAEIESWSKQEQGAKDISAGDGETEAAQFVAAIAQVRGLETGILATKILTNVASYGALSAAVIGEQQRLDDLIKAAATAEAVAAIAWTYAPPAE